MGLVTYLVIRRLMGLEAKEFVAGLAFIVSVAAFIVSLLRWRHVRLDAILTGLQGDRRAVTYAALTIRLAGLLRRNEYRRSLIASLLLAWNFETSDRARAAVLAALVEAKREYHQDYKETVDDISKGFAVYEAT